MSALEIAETIRDQACQLFRTAQSEDLLRGRSIEAMAAASVYGACRCNGRSRTLEDVTDLARVDQSRMRNAYQSLNTELGLPPQPVSPGGFIPRLASELEVSDRIRHRAERLAAESESTAVTTGVQPSGFAAACLYRAGREAGRLLTQSEVAEAANVSSTTIRNHQDALDELAE